DFGARALRATIGPGPPRDSAAQRRRPGHRSPTVDSGQPGRRADPYLPRGANAGSALEASLGAIGAESRPRGRLEFPPVPTGSGVPRARLLGLFVAGYVLRRR